MTKFTKGVLTIGLLVGLGIGGKYGYDYLKDHGYFDDVTKTNVPTETVEEIKTFLNDSYNIGFLNANYERIDINDIDIDTIAYLLNNQYEEGSDGKITKYEFTETKVYKEYVTTYETNLLNTRVCYDAVKLNDYIYSITNQRMDALENTAEACTPKLSNYIYMIDVEIDIVIAKNNIYTVTYNIGNAENILYNQKYNYTGIKTDRYNGKVVLERESDGRYIFISNEVKGARNLYNF